MKPSSLSCCWVRGKGAFSRNRYRPHLLQRQGRCLAPQCPVACLRLHMSPLLEGRLLVQHVAPRYRLCGADVGRVRVEQQQAVALWR